MPSKKKNAHKRTQNKVTPPPPPTKSASPANPSDSAYPSTHSSPITSHSYSISNPQDDHHPDNLTFLPTSNKAQNQIQVFRKDGVVAPLSTYQSGPSDETTPTRNTFKENDLSNERQGEDVPASPKKKTGYEIKKNDEHVPKERDSKVSVLRLSSTFSPNRALLSNPGLARAGISTAHASGPAVAHLKDDHFESNIAVTSHLEKLIDLAAHQSPEHKRSYSSGNNGLESKVNSKSDSKSPPNDDTRGQNEEGPKKAGQDVIVAAKDPSSDPHPIETDGSTPVEEGKKAKGEPRTLRDSSSAQAAHHSANSTRPNKHAPDHSSKQPEVNHAISSDNVQQVLRGEDLDPAHKSGLGQPIAITLHSPSSPKLPLDGRKHAQSCLRALKGASSSRITSGSDADDESVGLEEIKPRVLDIHLSYFDLDADGTLKPRDTYTAIRKLGFNVLVAGVFAVWGHAVLGALIGVGGTVPDFKGKFSIPFREARHGKITEAYSLDLGNSTRVNSGRFSSTSGLKGRDISPLVLLQQARQFRDMNNLARLLLGWLVVTSLTWPLNLTVGEDLVEGVYNGNLFFLLAARQQASASVEANTSGCVGAGTSGGGARSKA